MTPANTLKLPLARLSLGYLVLPLLIFFGTWLKPGYALLAMIPVLIAGWKLVRAWPVDGPALRPKELWLVGLFSLALTAFSGIGGLAPQHTDWIKHNAVLYDCIQQPWPVVIADGATNWSLVYYLAYYLPAALVGKVAGYAAAQGTLCVWTALGVWLTCLWFAQLTRLPVVVASLAFFAFGALTFVANLVVQVLGLSLKHGPLDFYPNEFWARIWEFHSHFWMFEWSPGQALAGWLSAGLFLSCPKPQRLLGFALLFTVDLFWSPFVSVGLFLLAFFLAGREGQPWPVKLTGPVLLLALPFGILAAFYAAKTSPEVAARFPKIPIGWFTQFHDAPALLPSFCLLGLFIVFEFGILLSLIRAHFPKGTTERHLADASGLALLCLLPVTMGTFSDLSMRGSTVPWFCLALLTARAVTSAGLSPKLRRAFWLVILIGGLTPLIQMAHQGYHLAIRRYDPRTVPHPGAAIVNMGDGGFNDYGAQYVGSTNSFFARHLAR